MKTSKETAQVIRTIAKKENVVIGKMLEELGLNKNTLSSMSSRGSWIQADSLGYIADYLNCSVDYLLGRTDNTQSHIDTGEISQDENKLLACFAALNDEGKEKAIERLEEMAALDKYKKGYQPYVAKEA